MPIPILSEPPKKAHESYVVPYLGGELITIPTSNSVMRLLVTGEETNGDFAVVTTGGISGYPIGFHYHREAHDVFLCQRGKINVWAADQCRTLEAGDFASVPPGVVHQYQMCSDHTEFVGLIIPGGWEEFFRFIGEPYSGPLFPTQDRRNPMEVLIPKLMAATEKFDMVPVRDHPSVEPQPWTEKDQSLPESTTAFYLKHNKGPKYAVGGLLVKPMVTQAQSNSKFSVSRIEGSSEFHRGIFTQYKALKFGNSHHCFLIEEGKFNFSVGYSTQEVSAGETLFVPAGITFKLSVISKFGAAYCFASGGGFTELLISVGTAYDRPVLDEEQAFDHDQAKWDELEGKLKFMGVTA